MWNSQIRELNTKLANSVIYAVCPVKGVAAGTQNAIAYDNFCVQVIFSAYFYLHLFRLLNYLYV